METSNIDAAGHAATGGTKAKKPASEIFGDVLAKFLDRIGATADDQSELDEPFFQTKPRAPVREDAVGRPEEPEVAETRKPRDEARDDLPPLTAAAVEAAREAQANRSAPGQNGTGETTNKIHPDATAAPQTPSSPTESGAAARVPMTAQARDPAAAANATPASSLAPGNTGNGAAQQIQVTVTQAPVQAQAATSMASRAALATQDQAADALQPTPPTSTSATTVTSAHSNTNADAGNGGANGGSNSGKDTNANSGQPGFNNLPAGLVVANAAIASAVTNAAATGSFAAAVEESAVGAIEGATALGQPASIAGAAAGLRRAVTPQVSPQLPRLSALEQIAINVQKAVASGKDQVTIQLRPEELGRIDVRLEVGKDGQVSAQVRADKPETLELLQRDARGLERALQDAGLRADTGSLSFGLRGENSGNGQSADTRHSTAANFGADPTADDGAETALPAITRAADGRVDLHV